VWGPLYEKTWAKVKGTFDLSEGGYFETGARALTGLPIMSALTTTITT
jgi:uncharacterized sodium:solute symporter family permease YidK